MYIEDHHAYIQWPDFNSEPRRDARSLSELQVGSMKMSFIEIASARFILIGQASRSKSPLTLDVVKCRVVFNRTEFFSELSAEFPSMIYSHLSPSSRYPTISIMDDSEAIQFLLRYR